MAESRFKIGQLWRDTGAPYEEVTITKVLPTGVYYDWPDLDDCFRTNIDFLGAFTLVTEPPAAAPAEQPKPECRWGYHDFDGERGDDAACVNCGRTRGELESRGPRRQEPTWDSDKYNGISSWLSLDERIAMAKAEHTRSAESAGLLHPRDYWSNRLRGGRRRG